MSLLPKYFYRRYMLRTLENRNLDSVILINSEGETDNSMPMKSLLSTINETYESAASGFFASSGNLVK